MHQRRTQGLTRRQRPWRSLVPSKQPVVQQALAFQSLQLPLEGPHLLQRQRSGSSQRALWTQVDTIITACSSIIPVFP